MSLLWTLWVPWALAQDAPAPPPEPEPVPEAAPAPSPIPTQEAGEMEPEDAPPPPAAIVGAPEGTVVPRRDPGPAGDAPVGAQTPCDWLIAVRDDGASMPRQIDLAQQHKDLFTMKDRRCVKEAGFHKRVRQALTRPTEDELAEREAEAEERKAERAADTLTDRFDVQFVGVVLGPGRAGGEAWDGATQVVWSDDDIEALSDLAGTSGVVPAGAIDVVVERAHAALTDDTSAPEVFGYVEYRGPSVPMHWVGSRLTLRDADKAASDTLYADFPGAPTLRGIRVRDNDVLRVSLFDKDPDGQHDVVNPIDLKRRDLDALAFQGGAGGLLVRGLSDGEVLVLLVAATPSETPSPAAKGTFYKP